MRIAVPALLRRLNADNRGSTVIETAVVAPVLLLLALGGVEASSMVARESELQSAAAEAAAIVRAAPPDTVEARTAIRDVLKASTGLGDDGVTVSEVYRCGTAESYAADKTTCGSGVAVSTYLEVVLIDRYDPTWTQFGIGSGIDYRVERKVQIS